MTNAEIHRNKKYVLNIDFENFFDSFHYGRIRGYFEKNKNFLLPIEIATIIAQLTCYNGSLPQGAPTSPIITNLICNILDMRLIKIGKRYKVDYTRYADDLTFSTNNKYFIDVYEKFYNKLKIEVEKFGLSINERKTRLLFKDSRQEVTGLVVNQKLSVKKEYYKNTRAMAYSLYKNGEFKIDDVEGTLHQLEGRFAYINQLDYYNNKLDIKLNNKLNNIRHDAWNLNSREKQYQKFLFFKYFLNNSKPLIVTEGKTDIVYIRAALKKDYLKYPYLIEKNGDTYEYKISFLRKTKRLKFFLNIHIDGADTMQNIYGFFTKKNNLYNYFKNIGNCDASNPVILIFDNEQASKRPLKIFLGMAKQELPNGDLSINLIHNLYLLTNPLVKGMQECEIEDLFDIDVLNHKIDGKIFNRAKDIDRKIYYGKVSFSKYISANYNKINFDAFEPMLKRLNEIVGDYN